MCHKLVFQIVQIASRAGLAPELVKQPPVAGSGPLLVFRAVWFGGKILQPIPVHAQVIQLARREAGRGNLPRAGAVMVERITQAVAFLALKHAVQHAGVVAKKHRFIVMDAFVFKQARIKQLVPAQRSVKGAGLKRIQ